MKLNALTSSPFFATVKAYWSSIKWVLIILILLCVYARGRHDGAQACELKVSKAKTAQVQQEQKAQAAAIEEDAQAAFEAAQKEGTRSASGKQRQEKVRQTVRTIKVPADCALNEESLKAINESLEAK